MLGLGAEGQEGPRGLMAWNTGGGLRDCKWSRGEAETWLGAGDRQGGQEVMEGGGCQSSGSRKQGSSRG